MSRNRGMRKEDRTATEIAYLLEERGRNILATFCAEIEALPEFAKLQQTPQISSLEWKQFITTVARKALAGEHVERTMHDFNRLYVFPTRKALPKARGK